jgi:chemotaxis protein MotB
MAEAEETDVELEEEEHVSDPPPEESPPCEEGAPGWVVTFGDMMSLLLTFFILLLSFATMEKIKYKVLAGSIQTAFGVQEVSPTFTRPQARKVIAKEFSMKFETKTMLDGMKKVEERQTVRTPSGRVDIEIFEDYRGVVVSIGEKHMFQPGKADLRPEIWRFLEEVLDVATDNNAQMQVEAHTDSIPIKTAEFPSNDHLSSARSLAVIEYLVNRRPEIPHARLEAIAAGSTRPRFPNLTARGREQNRRVEMIFYRTPQVYEVRSNGEE